ncbi:hypothetical protein B4U80_10007 [Leptotrombidium deliense]|uniref:Uncharacterized protein n=1 Tax=Leptotrombidium deliense TaxID=299467 RepID=A0A443RVW0_9ACAR|nr:hypothetical protein B4U80_10007 [Leptotrombidium deliense]
MAFSGFNSYWNEHWQSLWRVLDKQ